MKKVDAVIFDLDNCLAPATEVIPTLFDPVFHALRSTNDGAVSESELAAAFSDFWRLSLDVIEERYRFSTPMRLAGRAAYRELEVKGPMFGYGDLSMLRQIEVPKFLVTSGFRRLQESKIRALGIASLFEGIHVDVVDEFERKGKIGYFAEILGSYGLQPGKVLVVGDNPDSEIDAGNKLGMITIQILRAGIERGANAAFHISDFHQLLQMPFDFSGEKVGSIRSNFPLFGALVPFERISFPKAPYI